MCIIRNTNIYDSVHAWFKRNNKPFGKMFISAHDCDVCSPQYARPYNYSWLMCLFSSTR